MQDERMKLIFDLAQSSQNVDEFTKKLQGAKVEVEALGTAADKAKGSSGSSGQGILGASYAVQDFVSVLAGGQGLGRALGAITNNVGPVLTAFGLGSGLAGIVSLLVTGFSAVTPLIGKFFDNFSGDAAEKAKETLKEIEDRLKQLKQQFEALKETPTDFEKQAQEGLRGLLGERPTAEQVARGAAAGVTEKEARGAMTPEELEAYQRSIGRAGVTGEGITRAGAVAAMGASRGGAPPEQVEAARRDAEERARRDREAAQIERDERLNEARNRRAEQMVAEASQTGAGLSGEAARKAREAGMAARGRLGAMAEARPGAFPVNLAGRLAELEPGALEQADVQGQADIEQAEAFGQRAHQAGQSRRAAAAEEQARRQQQAQWEAQGKRNARQYDQQQDAALTSEVMAAAAPIESPREQQMKQARQGVSQMSQQLGYGMPSPQQADQMATEALQAMGNGMNSQAASWMAVMKKVEAINQSAKMFNEMQQRQQQMGQSAMDR